jgi:hypothetical protein
MAIGLAGFEIDSGQANEAARIQQQRSTPAANGIGVMKSTRARSHNKM